jgi:hypothetical protein
VGSVTHQFVSTVPDDSDPDTVSPSNWNDDHAVSLDAADIPFTPAGTIAATDVQAAIEEVASEAGTGSPDTLNVFDNGAIGDGTTDDTAAIQAVYDTAAATGGTVSWYTPEAKTVKVTAQIEIAGASPSTALAVNTIGPGSHVVTIKPTVALGTDAVFNLQPTTGSQSPGWEFHGLGFDLRDAPGCSGIVLGNVQVIDISRLKFRGGARGIDIVTCGGPAQFSHIYFWNQTDAGVVYRTGSTTNTQGHDWSNCTYFLSGSAADDAHAGFWLQGGGQDSSWYRCHAFRQAGISQKLFYGFDFDGPSSAGFPPTTGAGQPHLVNCVVDAVTDAAIGTSSAATSAAYRFSYQMNPRMTQCWASAMDTGLSARGPAVLLSNVQRASIENCYLSSQGVKFEDSVDIVTLTGNTWPNIDDTEPCLWINSATVTNVVVSPDNIKQQTAKPWSDDITTLAATLAPQGGATFNGAPLSPAQITANQDNYNPTGLAGASVLKLDLDAARSLTGLAGGYDGREIVIVNTSSFNLTLSNQSGSSTAGNRFIGPNAASVIVQPLASVRLRYDGGSVTRWRIVLPTYLSNTSPSAVGTAAAGTAADGSRRDHVHATGAGTPSTQAFGDSAATGTGPAAAMTDHKHAMPADPTTNLRTIDYLVGTASGELSGEIAVGTSPGGELGGTWASPTVDSTHSGSAHHDAITIGADTEHSLSGQVLSGADASTTQKGHVTIGNTAPPAVSTSGSAGAASTEAASKNHVHAHEAQHIDHDTLWAAKGDIVAGTANDTAAVVTAGTNGQMLTAQSGQSAGLQWATVWTHQTWSKSGTLTTSTGALKWYNRTGRTLTFDSVSLAVGTAPTGAAILVDVNVDGTTIYATQGNRPTIAISGTSSDNTTAPDTTTIADNHYLTVDVDQIGSTVAGADLTITVWMTG